MRTFQLIFYKNLNAFEIYRCDENGNPDTSHSFYLEDDFEWGFEWGDKLKIKWVPFGTNTSHYLDFTPAEGHPSTRRSPIKKYSGEYPPGHITLSSDPEIEDVLEFEKGLNNEAHWTFNFSWSSPAGGDHGSIDPDAKIKTPQ